MALASMHSKNILHRDLKPENLIFAGEELTSLKIVDFGLSTIMDSANMNMRCGSPGYVAPEILNDQSYNTKVDIFSVGVILYIMLTGKFIFPGRTFREILAKNKACRVAFPPSLWEKLSPDALDLVK